MLRPLTLAATLLLCAVSANARTQDNQLFLLVDQELSSFVTGVDAADLSQHQLATVYAIMHSGGSHGERTAQIRSVIGGGYSLRSLFTR